MSSEIKPSEKRITSSVLENLRAGLPRGQQQALTAAHHQVWIQAIRAGGPSIDYIESAVRSDRISQLADLCIRTGQAVRWDPVKQTIVGNDTAKAMMRKPMRSPWGVS